MIGFFCSQVLPNYIDDPGAYNYLPGKVSATGYYFWILKNHNISDIKLIHTVDQVHECDCVVFHYDDRDILNSYKGKKIQVVSDRPPLEDIDLYICCNEFILNPSLDINLIRLYGMLNMNYTFTRGANWKYIHYPPTYGIKKCKPHWPPKNFKFVGRRHTLIDDFNCSNKRKRVEDLGINLEFDFKSDANSGTEHVYFCIRDLSLISTVTGENNVAGRVGGRTPNRAFQAWYMNTPGIFNLSPEMFYLRNNDHDFLLANNFEEFYTACKRLTSDEELYWSMVSRCQERCTDNHYENLNIIVEQWKSALQSI